MSDQGGRVITTRSHRARMASGSFQVWKSSNASRPASTNTVAVSPQRSSTGTGFCGATSFSPDAQVLKKETSETFYPRVSGGSRNPDEVPMFSVGVHRFRFEGPAGTQYGEFTGTLEEAEAEARRILRENVVELLGWSPRR